MAWMARRGKEGQDGLALAGLTCGVPTWRPRRIQETPETGKLFLRRTPSFSFAKPRARPLAVLWLRGARLPRPSPDAQGPRRSVKAEHKAIKGRPKAAFSVREPDTYGQAGNVRPSAKNILGMLRKFGRISVERGRNCYVQSE
jgi:hypothetical protein